jgi:serine phosphatase RsbU (regulator of sigma subunit)
LTPLQTILAALDDLHDPSAVTSLARVVADVLGAESCHVWIADYALRSLRELHEDGTTGDVVDVEGTMGGRCFATGGVVAAESDGTEIVWVPMSDASARLGAVELRFENPPAAVETMREVVGVLALALVSRSRYTDVVSRARRSKQLTDAAEAQWDLLPPLSHRGDAASVSGAVEPAYDIGGDSFDYAFNPGVLQFAVLDAVGHGLEAVLMVGAAVHSLRNARRSGLSLSASYRKADERIATQFGHSFYVTGQIGSLDLGTGELNWVNAGHVLPLLVRDRSFVGTLSCEPSKPLGLGGEVREVAAVHLQPGDRVLFYSDGVTEGRAPDGSSLGEERLADLLVRATIDDVPVAETVRRLTAKVIEHVAGALRDDATMFLVEYGGTHATSQATNTRRAHRGA